MFSQRPHHQKPKRHNESFSTCKYLVIDLSRVWDRALKSSIHPLLFGRASEDMIVVSWLIGWPEVTPKPKKVEKKENAPDLEVISLPRG